MSRPPRLSGLEPNEWVIPIHGGRINLGNPDQGFYTPTQVYPAGALSWINNSFENTAINLDPTYYRANGVVNCDMQLLAYNNLFKGGSWLLLEPFPASAGHWTFRDNLFDKMDFLQDPSQPLDFDHNGYWPLQPHEFPYGSSAGELTASSGGTDGGNEVTLSNAPPYQSGAFGNFYLPASTPLFGAGSRSPADAGLFQYTTRLDQTKEGDETAGHMVNIGLHYVAASGNVSKDTDGDGVPDYVEDANGNGSVDGNETDPNNSMTDGVTNDIYNTAYDDIDLSGDGLVGRIKKALGINPLDASNPLTLKQVITGQEPDIATFELPISYNVLTNIGWLYLNVDGVEAAFDELDPATNGSCLLEWNTTYESPGFHYLSAKLTLSGSYPDAAVLSAQPAAMLFNSTNVLQFFESDTMFDDTGAFLDAQLPEQDATYTIQLYDPSTTPPTFIKGITNSTSSGTIQENWDLTYDSGVTVFTNDTVTAVFNVILSDPASATHIKTLHKLASNEQGNGFDVAYFYTPTNSSLAAAFGDFSGNYGEVWNGMQAVVDTLLIPVTTGGGHNDHYDSSFNNYTSEGNNTHGNGLSEGWPGYVNSQSTITNSSGGLLSSMADGTTKNFYCWAHGNLGNKNGKFLADYQADVYLTSSQVGNLLGNHFHNIGGLWAENPYRFVFLDGCATMDSKDWRRAFGIFPLDAPNQAARNNVGAQACVGWDKEHAGNYVTADLAEAYTQTLNRFYTSWMGQTPLANCIQRASDPKINNCPLPVPGNETVKDINGNPFKGETSKIYVSGHSGLTRNSFNSSFDKLYVPPAGQE